MISISLMRQSRSPDLHAVGRLQDEVGEFLSKRWDGFESFFEQYSETVLETEKMVAALDDDQGSKTVRISVPRRSRSSVKREDTPGPKEAPEDRVRFSDKWTDGDVRVSIDGRVSQEASTHEAQAELQSIATPVPEFDFSDAVGTTPPSQTVRMSYTGGGMEWGDRYRSMTPPLSIPGFRPIAQMQKERTEENFEMQVDRDALEPETNDPPVQITHEAVAQISETPNVSAKSALNKDETQGRKKSMIPKPPETVQKTDDRLTLEDAPADDAGVPETVVTQPMDAYPLPEIEEEPEKQEEGQKQDTTNVKSFMGCVKPTEAHKIAGGQHKAEIPALKKAAAAREMAQKREAERKKRKQLTAQWKQLQKKQHHPTKLAGKSDNPSHGTKRASEVEPSPNKKQRLETAKRNKKAGQLAAQARKQMANTTPNPQASGKGDFPAPSPQYNLTPAGLLATDTRTKRKERRREKRVPSWAEDGALLNSLAQQRNVDPATIFPALSTLNPQHVFGTPDSMVVRNAAERAFQYQHRNPSSCAWSDNEEDDE